VVKVADFLALLIVAGGFLYMGTRWGRSPRAFRAMIIVAACYFVAGAIVGISLMRPIVTKWSPLAAVVVPAPAVAPSLKPETLAPSLKPETLVQTLKNEDLPPSESAPLPVMHYDPASAVRPDPKVTPGDVFADAKADDVCAPGWAREHRNVSEADRERVYSEYPDSARTCLCTGSGYGRCCEVDHLIPLELGGSNDIKNLWPQPDMPKPGAGEKDSLENVLHGLVCNGTLTLTDAQHCIASDWVKCWETYVVPRYGAEWASANRKGW
jgi:hypothetical protein